MGKGGVFRGTDTNAKTVLCTRFQSPEGCRFGDRCNFAHGTQEVRPRPDGPPGVRPLGMRDDMTGYPSARGNPSSQFQSRGGPTWGGGEGGGQFGGSNPGGQWGAGAGSGNSWGGTPSWGSNGNLLGGQPDNTMGRPNIEPGNHGWSQHTAPEGYCYYYNAHSGVSQWERPLELDFPISGGNGGLGR